MIHTYYQYDPDKHSDKRFIGFTIATAAGLTAATAAGGVGLTGVGLAVGAGITAATVGLGAYGMSQAMKPPKMPAAAALPKPVQQATPSVAKAEAAAEKDITTKRRAMARQKTIYTGPLGITEEEKSDITKKTLLGV